MSRASGMTTVPFRPGAPIEYGWSADGKSATEIARDILHTRYRLDADLRALRAKFAPRRVLPLAGALLLALAPLALRYIRGRMERARR